MPYRSGRGTAGVPFHVLNRGARRLVLFEHDADYRAFISCIHRAVGKIPVRMLAYCIMPNHFHFVIQPAEDGQLSRFMKILLGTHSKRWHAFRQTTGIGAVYQGRFKAFPIQSDTHFFAVCRYVERNALRAGLVRRAEDWPWGSLFQRVTGLGGVPLSSWPIDPPVDWVDRVNQLQPELELTTVRAAVTSGRPYGTDDWVRSTARLQGLEHSTRPRGRPRKMTSGVFFEEKDTRRLF